MSDIETLRQQLAAAFEAKEQAEAKEKKTHEELINLGMAISQTFNKLLRQSIVIKLDSTLGVKHYAGLVEEKIAELQAKLEQLQKGHDYWKELCEGTGEALRKYQDQHLTLKADLKAAQAWEAAAREALKMAEHDMSAMDMNQKIIDAIWAVLDTPASAYAERVEKMQAVLPEAQAIIDAFGPIEEKPFPDGLNGTYLSPAGKMIDAKLIVQLKDALDAYIAKQEVE